MDIRIQINKNWVRKITEKYSFLHHFIRWTDGLNIEEQEEAEKDPRNYYFGASPLAKQELQPDGNWTDYFGENERQSGRLETMACTCYSFLNVLEALARRKYGVTWDKSDRFQAKMSGVSRSGNSMNNVLESARKLHGVLDQAIYPNQVDEVAWDEFYKDIPDSLQKKALYFLTEYEIGYEAVSSHPTALKEALKYSPIYCAGYAWYNVDGEYRSLYRPNHAFVIQRYDGNNPIARDSYEPFEKKLASNYTIAYPKIIILNKKNPSFNIDRLKKLIDEGKQYIVRADSKGEWYKITENGLEYKSSIGEISDELNKYFKLSPKNLNEVIRFLTQEGKVKWATEKEYFDLLT